jgi:hypothetical protein
MDAEVTCQSSSPFRTTASISSSSTLMMASVVLQRVVALSTFHFAHVQVVGLAPGGTMFLDEGSFQASALSLMGFILEPLK